MRLSVSHGSTTHLLPFAYLVYLMPIRPPVSHSTHLSPILDLSPTAAPSACLSVYLSPNSSPKAPASAAAAVPTGTARPPSGRGAAAADVEPAPELKLPLLYAPYCRSPHLDSKKHDHTNAVDPRYAHKLVFLGQQVDIDPYQYTLAQNLKQIA
jgi:hypothetical protein